MNGWDAVVYACRAELFNRASSSHLNVKRLFSGCLCFACAYAEIRWVLGS